MSTRKTFKVNEHFSGFDIEHIQTRETHWLSDGVDVLFDENEKALPPGGEEFCERWAAAFNSNVSETMEAYFEHIPLDLPDAPEGQSYFKFDVIKSYENEDGDTLNLQGTLFFAAASPYEAQQAVSKAMDQREISTIDARIKWEDKDTDGFEYVDMSFGLDE